MVMMPAVNADTVTLSAILLEEGDFANPEDEIVLDNDSTLDLTLNVVTVTETTATIGDFEVNLTQEVTFETLAGDAITLENSELDTAFVQIPDNTTVSAPQE